MQIITVLIMISPLVKPPSPTKSDENGIPEAISGLI